MFVQFTILTAVLIAWLFLMFGPVVTAAVLCDYYKLNVIIFVMMIVLSYGTIYSILRVVGFIEEGDIKDLLKSR